MPRTLESTMQAHDVAAQRRRDGRPVWDHQVKLRHLIAEDVDDDTAHERGRAIAAALTSTSWARAAHREAEHAGSSDLLDIISELEDIADLTHLNHVIDALYDLADADRAWIA